MTDEAGVVPVVDVAVDDHLPVREHPHPDPVETLLGGVVPHLRPGTLVEKGLPRRGEHPLPHDGLVDPVVDQHLGLLGVARRVRGLTDDDLDPPRIQVGKVAAQGGLDPVDLHLVHLAHLVRRAQILLALDVLPEPGRVARLRQGHVRLLVIHPRVMGAQVIHHRGWRQHVAVKIVPPYLILVHGVLILILSIGFLLALRSLGLPLSFPLKPGSLLHAHTARTNASE